VVSSWYNKWLNPNKTRSSKIYREWGIHNLNSPNVGELRLFEIYVYVVRLDIKCHLGHI